MFYREARRKILIAVLALGTIGGYASGFAHMRRARAHWLAHHDAVARCAQAAQNVPNAQNAHDGEAEMDERPSPER